MSERGGEQTLADVTVGKETCPDCSKRNSLVRYADGSAQCYTKGCGHREGHRPDTRPKQEAIPRGLLKPDGSASYTSIRSINQDTLRRYGAFLGGYAGGRQLVVPVYSNTGEMTAQQVRMKDGRVEYVGDVGQNPQLVGQHVFGDRNDKRVVVHSDAVDMMSTGQVMRLRAPCVSVLHDTPHESLQDIKANYRWLDRFEEIILFFKDTPEWQDAAQRVASLFGAGRVKIAFLGGDNKSPNEALQANLPGDIENAIYSATVWRPPGIVNAYEGREALFEEGLQTPSWPYPWEVLNEATMGMRPGEVTYHVGGTGIAKSTLMFHYTVHNLMDAGKPFIPNFPRQPPCCVGYLGFEDLAKQAKVAMLGIYSGRMLSLEPLPKAEGLRLFDELFGSRRLFLYDAEQAEYGLEAVKGYIRYLIKACDCRILYIDPLTFLVSQLPVANRTQAEDQLAGWLAAESKASGASFHIGYHLRKPDGTPFEEGGQIGLPDIKGSGALTHFAHNVLAYERDQQGPRPDLLRVRSLKNRVARYTGEVCILKYDMQTGNYTPTEEKWPGEDEDGKKAPSKNKPGGFTNDY